MAATEPKTQPKFIGGGNTIGLAKGGKGKPVAPVPDKPKFIGGGDKIGLAPGATPKPATSGAWEQAKDWATQPISVPYGRTTPQSRALEADVPQGSGYGLSFPTSGVGTTLTGGADRQKSSRIIILSMGVAGAAIIIGGSSIPAYQVGNTKVPGNMRAFAGVIIAGTVALVLNEVSPSLGMLFGISLIFVAVADVKAFTGLGDAIFGKANHVAAPKPAAKGTGPIPIQNQPPPGGGIFYPGTGPQGGPGTGGPTEIPPGAPSG